MPYFHNHKILIHKYDPHSKTFESQMYTFLNDIIPSLAFLVSANIYLTSIPIYMQSANIDLSNLSNWNIIS